MEHSQQPRLHTKKPHPRQFNRDAMHAVRMGEPLSTADLRRLLRAIENTDDALSPFPQCEGALGFLRQEAHTVRGFLRARGIQVETLVNKSVEVVCEVRQIWMNYFYLVGGHLCGNDSVFQSGAKPRQALDHFLTEQPTEEARFLRTYLEGALEVCPNFVETEGFAPLFSAMLEILKP